MDTDPSPVTAAFRDRFDLWRSTVPRFGATEEVPLHRSEDGSRCGRVTVERFGHTGRGGEGRVVDVSIAAGPVLLNTVVALTGPTTSLPHFSFEMAVNPDGSFLSLDLIPRVDPVGHPDYVARVYEPLEPARWDATSDPGIGSARARGIHQMLLSPWLLAVSVTAGGVAAADAVVSAYFDHWSGLLRTGEPDPDSDPGELAERDRLSRPVLYSNRATANWDRLDALLASGEGALLRRLFTAS